MRHKENISVEEYQNKLYFSIGNSPKIYFDKLSAGDLYDVYGNDIFESGTLEVLRDGEVLCGASVLLADGQGGPHVWFSFDKPIIQSYINISPELFMAGDIIICCHSFTTTLYNSLLTVYKFRLAHKNLKNIDPDYWKDPCRQKNINEEFSRLIINNPTVFCLER